MRKLLVVTTLLLASNAIAGVEEYKAAVAGFCDKMKMCISEKMEKEMGGNVPPQMQKMVDNMSSQMCAQYVPQMFEEKFSEHDDLIEKGTQCLTEMQGVSCSDFESGTTPTSCKEMESMAKAAGLVE